MSIVLKASVEADNDYRVMHGELQIGQIYKRKAALRPEAQWLWTLNGVPADRDALAISGLAPSLDDALAALKERWSRWLEFSGLTENGS